MSESILSEEEEERVASRLVDEALDVYRHLLSPDEALEIREIFIDLIVCHSDGRALLQQLLPERVARTVDASGAVTREGVQKPKLDRRRAAKK